jgi:ketosteroid isomerase-like protein
MKTLACILCTMVAISTYSQENTAIAEKIINLEKAALDRWGKGDVYGFLEISANDVMYFDPMVKERIDGIKNLTAYYLPAQGKIYVERFEIINPRVVSVDNMAVLAYNFKSYTGSSVNQWNCTEVYRLEQDGNWKIIQTHWSFTALK